jgi:hypothetical protein
MAWYLDPLGTNQLTHCFFKRQPVTPEEVEAALQAMHAVMIRRSSTGYAGWGIDTSATRSRRREQSGRDLLQGNPTRGCSGARAMDLVGFTDGQSASPLNLGKLSAPAHDFLEK